MNKIESQQRLEWIAYIIQQGRTGTPAEFAKKCNIGSEKTLLRQIEILREFASIAGTKILYDREKKTYYYDPPGKFTDFKFVKFD
jgi:predicted DNA-binding transcriptional regulator YafY